MKVRAGRLNDEDRKVLTDANRNGTRVLVAVITGEQFVGFVSGWDYYTLRLRGFSFETEIAWEDCVAAWKREDAPPGAEVSALIDAAREKENA
jgi:hypothetical protein